MALLKSSRGIRALIRTLTDAAGEKFIWKNLNLRNSSTHQRKQRRHQKSSSVFLMSWTEYSWCRWWGNSQSTRSSRVPGDLLVRDGRARWAGGSCNKSPYFSRGDQRLMVPEISGSIYSWGRFWRRKSIRNLIFTQSKVVLMEKSNNIPIHNQMHTLHSS